MTAFKGRNTPSLYLRATTCYPFVLPLSNSSSKGRILVLKPLVRPRRVVITGMGCVTPLGIGREAFWKGLIAGRRGVRKIAPFDAPRFPVPPPPQPPHSHSHPPP